ncbi:DNA cytosine methyltransferase [Salibacterium salarium]|uniref:Cytosine-specific methyltransferase n=1 Tax=Salibacterium salarium TaxID=284579 RepID=A0A428MUW0_9BACI|nr:DNA cytosine methyltransferase [Salibacterium salarium]RSL29918.1 DNA cytosine methyltransferase [Salibacterium salarium]
MGTLKVLDLFAGGGGFSTGFLNAECADYTFEIVKAVELDPNASETLRQHLGEEKVIEGDITSPEVKEEIFKNCKDVDVVIGGPPCQTFSLAGPARSGTKEMREKLKHDPRNTLYKHFLDIVESIQPAYVVFENVEGMLSKKAEMTDGISAKQSQVIELICDELEAMGYNVGLEDSLNRFQVLNAANYGTPQIRRRIIILANRYGHENPIPIQTQQPENYKTLRDSIYYLPVRLPFISKRSIDNLKKMEIVYNHYESLLGEFLDCIEGLASDAQEPIMHERLNQLRAELKKEFEKIRGSSEPNRDKLLTFIQKYNDLLSHLEINQLSEDITITTHQSRTHNLRDIIIFVMTKQGSNSARFMNEQHDDYHELLSDLYPYSREKHKDTYVKHSWDRPSNTILAHMEKDGLKFIHPEQPRTFTPYEAQLLQSFPGDFTFFGGRNAQYKQIGNAVPPILAQAIGQSILEKYVSISKKKLFKQM